MSRHVPIWLDGLPKARRPSFPKLKGEHLTRVAIVGGGLTGASCALSFASAGIQVVLLEAEAVGAGMTGADAGFVREGFAGSFHGAVAAHGLRTSRAAWDVMRRGALDFGAALRRYNVKCQLEAAEHIVFAPALPDEGRLLRREYQARHGAGIEGSWMTPAAMTRETAMETAGGLRTHGAVIDPYRACVGLMAAAASRGAVVHERSRVRRIRARKGGVDVVTDGGSVRAEAVIVATAAPIPDLRALRRHLRPEHAYGVVTEALPSVMRRQVGKRHAVLEDATEPGRLVRWLAGDRILVHGARQDELPVSSRERALTQRTGQLMYELSLRYPPISGLPAARSWDGIDYDTVDGLPLLGPHRNFPGHLFAFGSSRHGAGLAWVAARLVLRHYQGEATKADEALGFHRIL